MKKKVFVASYSLILVSLITIGIFLCASFLNKNLKPKYYEVRFNTMGGSIIPNVQVLQGTTIEKPTDPVKEGYAFECWLTYYGKKWDFSFQVVNENMTLRAQWTLLNKTRI